MKALSGLDGAFLHLETSETPMHVASLHVFDLPPGYKGDFHDNIKRLMRARLRLAPVFTRKLAPMPLQLANPVWVEDGRVDLDYHVRRVTLPKPGTRTQFEDCAGRLHAELLDRSRPLWQLVVIDGLQSGQAAYYFKVHHAVVDGQSGVMLAQTLFDLTPKPRRIAPGQAAPAEHPGRAELAAAALKHDLGQYIKLVRQLPELLKTLAGPVRRPAAAPAVADWCRTRPSARRPNSTGRFAVNVALPARPSRWTRSRRWPRHMRPRSTTSCWRCAAGCCGATWRSTAACRRKPLLAAMPISVREPGNTEYTTQATMALVNLNTQIADPVKRLRAIRDAAGAVKAVAKRAKGLMPTDFPTIGVPWVMHGLATLYGRSGLSQALPPLANVVISNVPGPQLPLYAAGARMASYWPMSIVEHGLGLNITVLSYAGAMHFGFTTALNVVGDARELSTALTQALDELAGS